MIARFRRWLAMRRDTAKRLRELGLRPIWNETLSARCMRIAMTIAYRDVEHCTLRGLAEIVGAILGKPFDTSRIREGVDGPASILITLPRDATVKQLVDVSLVLDGELPAHAVCRVEREA